MLSYDWHGLLMLQTCTILLQCIKLLKKRVFFILSVRKSTIKGRFWENTQKKKKHILPPIHTRLLQNSHLTSNPINTVSWWENASTTTLNGILPRTALVWRKVFSMSVRRGAVHIYQMHSSAADNLLKFSIKKKKNT